MTTKSNKSLVGLATKSKKIVAENEEKVAEKPPLTPEEERDIKAKARVSELLEDVPLDLSSGKKEELFEIEEPKGSEWLQEQVTLLSIENEKLKSENELLKIDLTSAKESYLKIFDENQRIKSGAGTQNDEQLKNGVLTIFHELQSNYLRNPGFTTAPVVGSPNFVIVPAAFLNRMILYFPFLAKEKRF